MRVSQMVTSDFSLYGMRVVPLDRRSFSCFSPPGDQIKGISSGGPGYRLTQLPLPFPPLDLVRTTLRLIFVGEAVPKVRQLSLLTP